MLGKITYDYNSISFLIGEKVKKSVYVELDPPFNLENYIWLNEVEKDQIRIYFIPSKLIKPIKQ